MIMLGLDTRHVDDTPKTALLILFSTARALLHLRWIRLTKKNTFNQGIAQENKQY